jgi:catechol 2,3-dioxygenase-like lactoylglutathione lyase family enzyme
MELKLELIILPVTDVDRAKEFYAERLGFVVDVDHQSGESFRVVQLTPPGSACSIAVGIGLTEAEPGTVRGLHLVVTDIVATRDELVARGADVAGIRHMGPEGWQEGPHPEREDYNSFAEIVDPDGNVWTLQERGHRRT